MKKLTVLIAMLAVATIARPQGFEGIIQWSVTTEIADPRAKAHMEQAQQKINDPATQTMIKELEDKMKDPNFKAMMESNPQMKAQMETMMKTLGGANMSSMAPAGLLIKIKSGNILTKMEGGMMDKMEILYLKDRDRSYRIDHTNKTYMPIPPPGNAGDTATDVKVTSTSETATILKYHCTKYIMEMTIEGRHSTKIFWTTTDIKNFDLKSLSNQKIGDGSQTLYYENLEGVPLKIEMAMPQGKMTMEVIELKPVTLMTSDFSIPPGYKETE